MIADIDLAGAWSVTLPDGVTHDVSLPGSLDLARVAPDGPDAGMAYLTRRHPFVGRAIYTRSFTVSAAQDGMTGVLVLERSHGKLGLTVDGAPIGRDLTLCTESRFLLGPLAAGSHEVVLIVDNSDFPAVGEALWDIYPTVAHSTSDHTQTNWNGVIGRMAVELTRGGAIAALKITPQAGGILVEAEIEAWDPNRYWPTFWTGAPGDALTLTVTLSDGRQVTKRRDFALTSSLHEISETLALPGAATWDEFHPVVHELTATWTRDGQAVAQRTETFGLREISREGRHILLNGRRIFLRGTLDCCIFPLTGHPPMDEPAWARVFATIRGHGLNHVRFHSWCPPRAAFAAADRMGLYLHVETPVWSSLGSDAELDAFIHQEAARIVAAYGNHPSFTMLAVGNEVAGPGLHAFLERFTRDWRARDSRRLYTGGSGWPTVQRADYLSKSEPRSHRWTEGLHSRLNARPLETLTDWSDWVAKVDQPLISHEIGQWCAFPDLDTMADYTGPLAPNAFARVEADLIAKGRRDKARDYLMVSGALQTALYKEDVEAALRTPDFAGFQLLGLQDFPGQGTALVGVVDAFWRPKPYDDPAAFAAFCGPIVPLLRAEGFVLRQGQSFHAAAQVAHYGADDLSAGEARWVLSLDGIAVGSGALPHGSLKAGALHDLGTVALETEGLPQGRYRLTLTAGGSQNGWDLWVMLPAKPALAICQSLDADTLARLESGEALVLSPSPETIAPNAELGHTTVFWNTFWTKGQAPHSLGLWNHTDHPIFADFPADQHTGWHQWVLTHGRRAMEVEGLTLSRIIDVVDDWNTTRDLTLLAEVQVGKGRLVLSAIDFTRDDPVVEALGAALERHLARPASLPILSRPALEAWAARELRA